MSLIGTWCRFTLRKVNNVHKIGGYVNRSAVTVADYDINWVRPPKIPAYKPEKSGDLGLKVDVQPTELCLYYDRSTELEDANDIVKKMFMLQFNSAKDVEDIKREKVMGLVRRHKSDRGSAEARIAAMTCEIQRLQLYVENHPRNKVTKQFLRELIDKRKKLLKNLRTWDYRRFEWILERLNLVYKPHPEKYGQVPRKESITRLTDKYCNDVIQQKLDAYKNELKAQQKSFYTEKAEKLEMIRKDELEYGLQPTVTEKDIQKAWKKAKAL